MALTPKDEKYIDEKTEKLKKMVRDYLIMQAVFSEEVPDTPVSFTVSEIRTLLNSQLVELFLENSIIKEGTPEYNALVLTTTKEITEAIIMVLRQILEEQEKNINAALSRNYIIKRREWNGYVYYRAQKVITKIVAQ